MKKLLSNISENSSCKVPAPEVKTSVKWAKYSLAVSAALLAGLLPVPANAQVSQERSELLSEQDQIAQQQLSGQNEGTFKGLIEENNQPLNSETVNNLSLGSKVAKPIDGVTEPVLVGDDPIEVYATEASTTYLANPQVSPSQCTSSVFENYGCYAIKTQPRGMNSSYATANGSSYPSSSALNAQEKNSLFFMQDPPGTWLQTQYPSPLAGQPKSGFNEFAIGAAKVMNDWHSPVFFEAEFGFGNQANAVLESITFTSPYSNVLTTLCGSGFEDKKADVSTVARNCAFSIGINSGISQTTVSSIDIAYWPVGANTSQTRIDRTYAGSSLDSFILNNFNRAVSSTYVWDPPETAQASLETIEPVPEPSSMLGLLTFGLFSTISLIKHKRK